MELSHLALITQVNNVFYKEKNDNNNDKNEILEGTLCIASHHLILSSRQAIGKEITIMHRNIDVVEKKYNNQNSGGTMILKCKDFRIYQLDISSTDDLNNAALSLERLSCVDQSYQYPFYKPQTDNNSTTTQVEDGWTAFTPVSEWSRLLATHADEWRICYVNRDYKVCDSYPSAVIVPRHIEDKVIVSAAKFRDGGRFPVLCYRHEGGSILMRSSQPLSGTTGKRCKEDERLLNSVLGPGRRGYIVDTRSSSQTQMSKSRGGGTEMDAAYPQWRKVNKQIPRSTELAESYYKLIEACNYTKSSMSQWLSRLENSGWLSAVQSALNAACVAAQCLHQEAAAVLVHGGAGRDCTLIVTSLAQAILSPDCRTVRGLEALIEREWLQAGHSFFNRTRHGPYYPPHPQNTSHSPIFLLFLDCLYQLNDQFQYSFEYTTDFLIEILRNVYCSNYGTFLGDSESDRIKLRLSERTGSFWSYINQPDILEKWLNPLYEPNSGVIWPSVAPVSIKLWMELYLSHTIAKPWDGNLTCAIHIKRNHTAVRKIAGQLHSQILKGIDDINTHPNSSFRDDDDDNTTTTTTTTTTDRENIRIDKLNIDVENI